MRGWMVAAAMLVAGSAWGQSGPPVAQMPDEAMRATEPTIGWSIPLQSEVDYRPPVGRVTDIIECKIGTRLVKIERAMVAVAFVTDGGTRRQGYEQSAGAGNPVHVLHIRIPGEDDWVTSYELFDPTAKRPRVEVYRYNNRTQAEEPVSGRGTCAQRRV